MNKTEKEFKALVTESLQLLSSMTRKTSQMIILEHTILAIKDKLEVLEGKLEQYEDLDIRYNFRELARNAAIDANRLLDRINALEKD